MGIFALLAPVLAKALIPLLEKLFDKLFNDSQSYNSTMADKNATSETKNKETDAFLEKVMKELPTKFEGSAVTTSGDLDSAADVQTLIDELKEQKATLTAAGNSATKVDSMIESLESARDNLKARAAAGTSSGDKDFEIQLSPKPGSTVVGANS